MPAFQLSSYPPSRFCNWRGGGPPLSSSDSPQNIFSRLQSTLIWQRSLDAVHADVMSQYLADVGNQLMSSWGNPIIRVGHHTALMSAHKPAVSPHKAISMTHSDSNEASWGHMRPTFTHERFWRIMRHQMDFRQNRALRFLLTPHVQQCALSPTREFGLILTRNKSIYEYLPYIRAFCKSMAQWATNTAPIVWPSIKVSILHCTQSFAVKILRPKSC